MLDQYSYRREEDLAKQSTPNWRIFDPIAFEEVGFPIRVNNINDIGKLLDTMQENRFDGYMQELGGLTDFEYDMVLDACYSSIVFQLTYLPHQTPLLPLSTLLSSFCIYKKLRAINSDFRSVLEIGPGCGYLSFFLSKRVHLSAYTQIETCESFYLLQNLINLHCFGIDFDETAILRKATKHTWRESNIEHTETPHYVNVTCNSRCTHIPWWFINSLYASRFKIVTANAAFSEFSDGALDQYLSLIDVVLEPDGFILAQCLGHGGPQAKLFDKFDKAGFALLARPVLQNDIINVLWARKDAFIDDDLVDRVFYKRPENRKFYTIEQFVAATEALFK